MTGDRKDGKQTAERDGKARKPLSRDGNAKEASDARAETVRRIMKRNRDSGESCSYRTSPALRPWFIRPYVRQRGPAWRKPA